MNSVGSTSSKHTLQATGVVLSGGGIDEEEEDGSAPLDWELEDEDPMSE